MSTDRFKIPLKKQLYTESSSSPQGFHGRFFWVPSVLHKPRILFFEWYIHPCFNLWQSYHSWTSSNCADRIAMLGVPPGFYPSSIFSYLWGKKCDCRYNIPAVYLICRSTKGRSFFCKGSITTSEPTEGQCVRVEWRLMTKRMTTFIVRTSPFSYVSRLTIHSQKSCNFVPGPRLGS